MLAHTLMHVHSMQCNGPVQWQRLLNLNLNNLVKNSCAQHMHSALAYSTHRHTHIHDTKGRHIARNFGRSLAIPGQFCKLPAHASIEMYGVKFIIEYHKSGKVAI